MLIVFRDNEYFEDILAQVWTAREKNAQRRK